MSPSVFTGLRFRLMEPISMGLPLGMRGVPLAKGHCHQTHP